ncbi:MAG: hypothetical protein AAF222_00660 [Pseudomonadota bacterium]
MTHTPPILSLSHSALERFLALLPKDRITRSATRIIVHAEMGDAIWHATGNRWLTTAPGDHTARRFGASGRLQ